MEDVERPEGPARPTLTLADLQRWEDNGASWRTLECDEDSVLVELSTCYGEPVDVVRGDEPGLIEFIRRRRAENAREPPGA